jgi:hypothetical protein
MSEIIGYHGTDQQFVDSIQKNGYSLSGKNNWFGEGVYFFCDLASISKGETEAKDWAIYVKHFNKWAIFKATIKSSKGADLVENIEMKQKFDLIKKELIDLHLKRGLQLNQFKEQIIFTKLAQEGFDYIIAMVDGGKKDGYNSYYIRRPQIQLCVKNIKCIVKNELVKQGERSI